jgi:peptidoglycan/xylan/chitin deacetylase (PgdA/CDA1 family)
MRARSAAILTYHSLDTSGSVISVAPATFRRQMEWLARSGMPVVPLARIRQTPGAVALTFDDAFRNFFEVALPILAEHRFPATVFVVSGHCGGRNNWPGQSAGIPIMELMDWSHLREASGHGIDLGGHTASHPRLTELGDARVSEELRVCRCEIEQRAGCEVRHFAYPYGSCDARVRMLAANEYSLACGTALDYAGPRSDDFELPRLDAYYLRSPRWFEGMHTAEGRMYLTARRWLRRVRGRFMN